MPPKLKPVPPPIDVPEKTVSNPLEGLLGYQLRRASVCMLADLASSLSDLELRVTEASVLMVLLENPSITQSEIGRTLDVQRANMVPLTTQLERRGLICRAAAVGRAQALRLTAEGEAIAKECQKRIEAHEARFLTRLPCPERDKLVAQIREIWED
ncbi:MarR family winged helix-turn-helix transcriptional regulator [Acidocella sp.]|uniref:MarR family winged helix-turn-helix transcriptional regulator n=1 Tax=Acidocella sp. TaxID=50710 RepID=UPI0026198F67|nr:MarR family transcriptional regulator [Acidocella sp.]